jgi:hypothetical protein
VENVQKHNICINVPSLKYSRSYIVWTVTFDVRWPGYVARRIKGCVEVSGRETPRKLLGRRRVNWETNFKIVLMETGDDTGGRWN